MKFAGWYNLVIGILMLAQWGFFLATRQVPEVHTAPVALAFHLAAEAATALALMASGFGLLNRKPWAKTLALIALGMLAYTAVVSPGYFAQQGAWPLVAMFAVILALGAYAFVRVARPEAPSSRRIPARLKRTASRPN